MKLVDVLQAVKEERLGKDALDHYHTLLSALYADMQLEIASLKKEKAIFEASDPNKSVAKMKVEWKATEKGQKLIQLEGEARAAATQLRSLKNRLYSLY